MTITENNVTKVYDEKNNHVATIHPWLEGWKLLLHAEKKALWFSVHADALYNAH